MKLFKKFAASLLLVVACVISPALAGQIPGGSIPDIESMISDRPFSSTQAPVQNRKREEPITVRLVMPTNIYEEGKSYTALLEVKINEEYHANSADPINPSQIPTVAKFTIDDERVTVGRVVYPPAEMKKFAFSKDKLSVYEGVVYIAVSISFTGGGNDTKGVTKNWSTTLNAKLDYQVCTDNLCLMPMRAEASEVLKIGNGGLSINEEIFAEYEKTLQKDEGLLGGLESSTGFGMFLLVFLGGLALNLTPCVYPIIPVTIGYFGQAVGRPKSETVRHAFVYLLGMASMYSVLGTFAALTGALFGELMQNSFVILLLVGVMLALSLSMFGLYDIRVPQFLLQFSSKSYRGYSGTFFMGLTVGIIAAPCVGPFVIALLTFVGERQDPLLGFALFFVLALGLGLPFVILAIFSGAIGTLPKSGVWMEWVRDIFGVILVGMALYFAQPLLSGESIRLLAGLIAFGGALYLFRSGRVMKGRLFIAMRWIVSALFIILALYILAPGDGKKSTFQLNEYNPDAFDESAVSGNPTMVYFTADWCVPCRELKLFTFSDEMVIAAVKEKRYKAFVIDLTTLEPEEKTAKERFNIKGVPTVILYDTAGAETKRFTGFIPPEEFLSIL